MMLVLEPEQCSEIEIIQAIESNLWGHFSYLERQHPEMQVIDEPDLLIVNSGLATDTFNYITRAQFTTDRVHSRINQAIDYFQSQNLPFSWWLNPTAQPNNLAHFLTEFGLRSVESELGMAANLKEIPQNLSPLEGLKIIKVTTLEELADFAEVIAANWQPPAESVIQFYQKVASVALASDSLIQFYVGYWNEKPVAASELFLEAGVAGLYCISTRLEFRNRGIGSAITLAPLLEAAQKGYRMAILQASETGENLYRRLGFKPYCNFDIYQF